MILVSTALLSTVSKDFKMKKLQSRVKNAFYCVESGLDEAYGLIYSFLSSAIESLSVEEELGVLGVGENNISVRLSDIIEGKSQCNGKKVSLKAVLEDKENYTIRNENCPTIKATVSKKNNCYSLKIESTYTDKKIVKIIEAEYEIVLPDKESILTEIDVKSMIGRKVWKYVNRHEDYKEN